MNAGLWLLIFCLNSGFILGRLKLVPATTAQGLNSFITFIALPAVVFTSIHKLLSSGGLTREMIFPASMAWMQFALAGVIFYSLYRLGKIGRSTCGALILTSGLGNTSFLGFPLLETMIGPSALPTAVIADQFGSFFVLSTLGVFVATAFSQSQSTRIRDLFLKLVTYPPMLALLAAFALSWAVVPTGLNQMLERVGQTLIPLALVSVGLRIRPNVQSLIARQKELALGLTFKLLFVPALMLGIALLLEGKGLANLQLLSSTAKITILESATATMITAAIVATEAGLDPEISSLMIGIGIPLSLITVPALGLLLGVWSL